MQALSPFEQPIRVAMLARAVFPLHGFGGIERHVFHLVTHLSKLGAEVTLYVQPPTKALETLDPDERHAYAAIMEGLASVVQLRYDYTSPYLRPNSILGRQINYPRYTWEQGCDVARAVRQGQFDVVHAQGLCAFGYGAIRVRDAFLRSVPFVANPHGLEEFRTQDWRKWLAYAPFRALYAYGTRCADRAIATDACTKDDLPHYLDVDPARVAVIPSAIDVDECLAWVHDELRVQMRERFQLDGAGPVLLSVSRLERNKGYHILVEALARLKDVLPPNWRWILVGQGKEREALEQQARAAGIGEHTLFAGRLDDSQLHSLYEEVDLLVHPTLYEGSSLVTLEGMIHRRPVVASAAGGIPDKVFDDINGYLVQPGDVDDLAHKLRLALEQRERWPEWGKASVEIVRRDFDWPVVARKTMLLYQELLRSRLR